MENDVSGTIRVPGSVDDEKLKEEILDLYVDCLKAAYTQLRRRIIPEFKGPGSRLDHKWRHLAQVLSAESMDPYAYVRFAFERFLSGNPDVYVEVITSPKMANEFIKERPKIKEEIRQSVATQAEKLRQRLAAGFSLEKLLTDEHIGFSPVFRFATAWSEKKFDIAERYKADAMRQLNFEPLYRELFKPWLPKELQ